MLLLIQCFRPLWFCITTRLVYKARDIFLSNRSKIKYKLCIVRTRSSALLDDWFIEQSV